MRETQQLHDAVVEMERERRTRVLLGIRQATPEESSYQVLSGLGQQKNRRGAPPGELYAAGSGLQRRGQMSDAGRTPLASTGLQGAWAWKLKLR